MQKTDFTFIALGTHWQVDIYETLKNEVCLTLEQSIRERIILFEETYSRFKKTSWLNKTAKIIGEHIVPKDSEPMLEVYQKLYQITDGVFTPLIGQVLNEAGYDTNYSFEPKILHHPPRWEDILDYDPPKIRIKQPASLDFGGVGKGYAVDLIGDIIEKTGIKNYCIDAGGDIRYRSTGNKFLRVGLENPNDTNQIIGTATILNKSVCGSAGNRRAWNNFHHIINPITLTSRHDILATWTIADETIIADALATCLFLVNPKTLTPHFDFEYLILNSDFSIQKSSAFPAEIFTT